LLGQTVGTGGLRASDARWASRYFNTRARPPLPARRKHRPGGVELSRQLSAAGETGAVAILGTGEIDGPVVTTTLRRVRTSNALARTLAVVLEWSIERALNIRRPPVRR